MDPGCNSSEIPEKFLFWGLVFHGRRVWEFTDASCKYETSCIYGCARTDLALLIDLCTFLFVKAHFFTTTKMCFCFLKFGCYYSWNVLSQGIQTHILFPSWSNFWVLNKFLWFSHRNTQLELVCVVTKKCHEGSPLFPVFGHTYLGYILGVQGRVSEKLKF